MPLHQDPTRFPDGERRAAALLLGLGAAGVLATCVSYVLAGAPAALPGGAPDFDTLKARLIDLRLRARRALEAMLPALRDGL